MRVNYCGSATDSLISIVGFIKATFYLCPTAWMYSCM